MCILMSMVNNFLDSKWGRIEPRNFQGERCEKSSDRRRKKEWFNVLPEQIANSPSQLMSLESTSFAKCGEHFCSSYFDFLGDGAREFVVKFLVDTAED